MLYVYMPYAGKKIGAFWIECFNNLDDYIITQSTAYAIFGNFKFS